MMRRLIICLVCTVLFGSSCTSFLPVEVVDANLELQGEQIEFIDQRGTWSPDLSDNPLIAVVGWKRLWPEAAEQHDPREHMLLGSIHGQIRSVHDTGDHLVVLLVTSTLGEGCHRLAVAELPSMHQVLIPRIDRPIRLVHRTIQDPPCNQ